MISLSSRRPLFWVLFSLLSLSGIIFTWKFFTQAFPIASIDVKVDRQQVLAQASDLAKKYSWGPKIYRQAASFEVDSQTKNYIELEAGGTQAFNEMITGTLYSPFTWQVRHFSEGKTNETLLSFKPDGTPYDFLEKIAETVPGEKLSPTQAQKLAEQKATADWDINLEEYSLIESSQEIRATGRADHTFTYERPVALGEAHYRLRLTVTGDKLTEVNHFIKIPEGFFLRYAQMRSSNKVISSMARMAMYILYFLFGCCVGLFLLTRQKFILWRPALIWGLILAFLQLISSFNELPLRWMQYDTALSAQNFLLQQSVNSFINSLVMLLLYTLSFAAAEGLTRKAFGGKIQFWKLWSPNVANSLPVLGRTIGGYLMVGFDLALIVTTYLITRTFFGWWLPSDTLINPNILATYLPWFSPSTQALGAGFWEECLFRAVPLASAALIGKRFGKRNLFLVIGFILQALIFGAAHADYPTQPAYGRLLELILPSFIFGGIYLVYGLLPGIVSHFIFDLVLMAMPLFISSAPGAWIQQGAVIIWGAIPLLVIIYFRFRKGSWTTLKKNDLNEGWTTPPSSEGSSTTKESKPLFSFGKKTIPATVLVGISTLALWMFTTQFKQDASAVHVTHSEAITIAQQALADQKLDTSWQALPIMYEGKDVANRYVWQDGGEEGYQKLVALYYVPQPQWIVRFAKFTGDLEQRAEEYTVYIAHDGTPIRIAHRLPEKQSVPSLSEERARRLAHEALLERFNLDKEKVEEVSATPAKHPERTDWTFVFNNQEISTFKDGNGKARITITISGNTITDIRRFIHVPEEWARNDRNQITLFSVINALSSFLLMLCAGILALYALISFNFSLASLLSLFAAIIGLNIASYANSWPTFIALFATSEAWSGQVFRTLASLSMSMIVISLIISFVFSMAYHMQKKDAHKKNLALIIPAVVAGILFAATSSVLKLVSPSLAPLWASFGINNSYFPLIGTSISVLTTFLYGASILLAVVLVINMLSSSWTKYTWLYSLALVVTGFLITSSAIDSISMWVLKGIIIGIILVIYQATLLRSFPSLIILTAATSTCLGSLQQMVFGAFPGAFFGNFLGVVAIIAVATYAYKLFND
jgi:hypothetical protein